MQQDLIALNIYLSSCLGASRRLSCVLQQDDGWSWAASGGFQAEVAKEVMRLGEKAGKNEDHHEMVNEVIYQDEKVKFGMTLVPSGDTFIHESPYLVIAQRFFPSEAESEGPSVCFTGPNVFEASDVPNVILWENV